MHRRRLFALLALAAALILPAASLAAGRTGPDEFNEPPPCSVDNADEDCVYV